MGTFTPLPDKRPQLVGFSESSRYSLDSFEDEYLPSPKTPKRENLVVMSGLTI